MSWLQISRIPLGFLQTQRSILSLITHAYMMSATLLRLPVQERGREAFGETGFNLRSGMLL